MSVLLFSEQLDGAGMVVNIYGEPVVIMQII